MKRMLIAVLVCGLICLLETTVALTTERVYGELQDEIGTIKEYTTLQEYEKVTGKKIEAFNEAPMLRVKVAAGEIPPIEQRLPQEPLVMEPLEEIGKYGGVLYRPQEAAGRPGPVHQDMWEPISLIDRENLGKVHPNVAKGWEFSDDGKTLTIFLRKGMKWSDGVPFTADDILFHWNDVILNKEITPIFPFVFKPKGKPIELKKIDDYTIEIHSSVPCWSLPYILSFWYGRQGRFYSPKHALTKYHIKYNPKANELAKEKGLGVWWRLFNAMADVVARPSKDNQDVPTLAPWIIKKILPNRFIYERNPYYWKIDTDGNQLPYIDQVMSTCYEGRGELHVIKIREGEIDLDTGGLAGSDYPSLKEGAEKGKYYVFLADNLHASTCALWFNQNYNEDPTIGKFLRNLNFRRALSLAIDRKEVIEMVGSGYGLAGQPTVHPSSSIFKKEWLTTYAEYNPEKSNELLDEIGLNKRDSEGHRLRDDGKPLTIVLTVWPGWDYYIRTAELVREYWENVGIKTIINPVSADYMATFIQANKHQVVVAIADPSVEAAIATVARGAFYKSEYWAPMWYLWWESEGKEGIEPPEEIKRVWLLCDSLPYLPEQKRKEALQEICEFGARNLFVVGTAKLAECSIRKVGLGNARVPYTRAGVVEGGKYCRLEQVFWREKR